MIREYRWRASPALARSLLLPGLLAATGLALGRADLVLLGVPLILGTALALGGAAERRARRPPPGVRATGPRIMDVGLPAPVAVVIGPSDAQLVTTVLAAADTWGEADTVAVTAPASHERQLVTEVTPSLWGAQLLARPDHLAVGADALLLAGPMPGVPATAQVLPSVIAPVSPGGLPPRPAGMVGAHRTRRPGEGTELHDVSPFQPGDRLRRIDWRVTARQGGPRETLYTRRTLVDADADVVCCLDNRFDLRADVASWLEISSDDDARPQPGGRSSIDIAVDTVASLAAAYIEHGDRVGVLDLARPLDPVHLGSGRRHLLRLRTHLARHTRRPGSGDALPAPRHAPQLPPGAIVVVTSVFLDDAPGTLAVTWRRRGHPVLVVDVLPSPLAIHGVDTATAVAARLVLAERHERIRALEAAGVPVSAADPAALALSLAQLRRHARGGRR